MNKEVIEGKTTWLDIFRQYDPNITEEEVTAILWNETCYPFSDETAIKQIEQFYESKKVKP